MSTLCLQPILTCAARRVLVESCASSQHATLLQVARLLKVYTLGVERKGAQASSSPAPATGCIPPLRAPPRGCHPCCLLLQAVLPFDTTPLLAAAALSQSTTPAAWSSVVQRCWAAALDTFPCLQQQQGALLSPQQLAVYEKGLVEVGKVGVHLTAHQLKQRCDEVVVATAGADAAAAAAAVAATHGK